MQMKYKFSCKTYYLKGIALSFVWILDTISFNFWKCKWKQFIFKYYHLHTYFIACVSSLPNRSNLDKIKLINLFFIFIWKLLIRNVQNYFRIHISFVYYTLISVVGISGMRISIFSWLIIKYFMKWTLAEPRKERSNCKWRCFIPFP